MESKDLMIGDWVCTESDSTPRQISWIRTGEVGLYWNKVVTPPYLVPIPITPEILEKNGWKNISDHTLKGCETFRLHLEQRSFDYTLTLKMRDYFRFDSYDDRVYTLCEVNFGFKYVHELQHAFRICGIDKEIEL